MLRLALLVFAVVGLIGPESSAQVVSHQSPGALIRESTQDFQKGELAAAEQTVREALNQAPHDPAALGLLGVVLDAQKRYADAEQAYKQALAYAPNSPALLNNLGNHFRAEGKQEEARAAFLKVVTIDPHHANANLQLAQLSVAAKQGAAALVYLNRLDAKIGAAPPVAALRAQALVLAGQAKSAVAVLNRIELGGQDSSLCFSAGMTYVSAQDYSGAERAFSQALDGDPTNFDVLYNLGLAAQHAGHFSRALEVYSAALRRRPDDADCLFNLASAYVKTGRPEQAVAPLMEAHKVAPQRPEILFALSQASQEIGFYGDAATALDEYLKLNPHDDIAHRERGFCLVLTDPLSQEGLADLRWYAQRHPKDARGLYEFAIAETTREPDKALQHLDQALTLDTHFTAARRARAELYTQMSRIQDSIADLNLALAAQPDDPSSLELLGEDYMRSGRYPEACEVLARAFQLTPKEPRVLTHYARVLARLGKIQESEKVMADFRALSPEERGERPDRGLFDYLNLSPEQRSAKYLANLQRNITTRPDDPALRVQLGKALIRQNEPDQAIAAFQMVRNLTSDPGLLAACGKALFLDGEYAASREFLEAAVNANPGATELRLDLALAVFHSGRAESSLMVLDATPQEQRKGDYFLVRAQILDSMDRYEEAFDALRRGLETAPTRVDLYFESSLFLIKHEKYQEAVRLLEQANEAIPRSPELQLLQAATFELVGDDEGALHKLASVESFTPEWSLPYLFHGIALVTHRRFREAVTALENGMMFGADNSIGAYYLALALFNSTPARTEESYDIISKLLPMSPTDTDALFLAGKIDLTRKDYDSALTHLTQAVRLQPELAEAHRALAQLYTATGEKEKSAAELRESIRLKQPLPNANSAYLPFTKLLFSIPAPRHAPL